MKTPGHNGKLEGLIDQALHEIPLRSAPAALERRVFAELERRAAQSWWRKDFLYWPVAARLAFLIASAGVIRWVLRAPAWVRESSLDLPPEISWIQATANGIAFAVHHLPALVVYGGLTVLVLLYVAFFGIGAIAYRSLYANHP